MSQINIKVALDELNTELKAAGVSDTIYTLGGAALYLLGYEQRATNDVDDLRAVMDGDIFVCAKKVSEKLGIDEFWLNTGAAPLVSTFERGWKSKCVLIFTGSNLKVFSVDRQTLISTKLAAACNRRGDDSQDLKWLRPTREELRLAKKYVIRKSGHDIPEVVIDAEIEDILNG